MGILQCKIDLLKLKNACVINVNGNAGVKKGVFIPIEDNNLFVSSNSAYINFVAFETLRPGKFGETHIVKQSFGKEILSKMSEEEKKEIPIIGNIRPLEKNNTQQHVEAATYTTTTSSRKEEDADSLPF